MAKLSENIVLLRHQNQMSQSALAEKLFVTPQAVSRWERGETEPDVETIKKLAEVFEVTVEQVINGQESMLTLKYQARVYKAYLIGSIAISFVAVLISILTLVGVDFLFPLIILVALSLLYLGLVFFAEMKMVKLKRTRKQKETEGTK